MTEQSIVNLYLPQAIEILLLNKPIFINSGRIVKKIQGGRCGQVGGSGGIRMWRFLWLILHKDKKKIGLI